MEEEITKRLYRCQDYLTGDLIFIGEDLMDFFTSFAKNIWFTSNVRGLLQEPSALDGMYIPVFKGKPSCGNDDTMICIVVQNNGDSCTKKTNKISIPRVFLPEFSRPTKSLRPVTAQCFVCDVSTDTDVRIEYEMHKFLTGLSQRVFKKGYLLHSGEIESPINDLAYIQINDGKPIMSASFLIPVSSMTNGIQETSYFSVPRYHNLREQCYKLPLKRKLPYNYVQNANREENKDFLPVSKIGHIKGIGKPEVSVGYDQQWED